MPQKRLKDIFSISDGMLQYNPNDLIGFEIKIQDTLYVTERGGGGVNFIVKAKYGGYRISVEIKDYIYWISKTEEWSFFLLDFQFKGYF